ncbi:hypothetical protein Taro_000661 [Colocasia esculenta]|uniref:Uncharacterized protein n=1 Tax=Colocasia esculenta TaxID=4460 RepID=A0A843TDW1_COLES|nr:hypothetical protein [Colocasia esculenta]
MWGYKYPTNWPPRVRRDNTLPEEAFWRLKGAFQIVLHLQKLQTILSRGRTWESRGISGEKLVVQGKGADPTEEEHFCIVSHRALVCESSHSLCGLSRHAQFEVVVLQMKACLMLN